VKATFKALKSLRSLEEIAAVRGVNAKGLRMKAKTQKA
jgi:ribosomal protein S5